MTADLVFLEGTMSTRDISVAAVPSEGPDSDAEGGAVHACRLLFLVSLLGELHAAVCSIVA